MIHLLCAVKRARILKEGSLTLIPYGMDERLKWSERIAHFTRQARFVPVNFVDVPLHTFNAWCLPSSYMKTRKERFVIYGQSCQNSPMPPHDLCKLSAQTDATFTAGCFIHTCTHIVLLAMSVDLCLTGRYVKATLDLAGSYTCARMCSERLCLCACMQICARGPHFQQALGGISPGLSHWHLPHPECV